MLKIKGKEGLKRQASIRARIRHDVDVRTVIQGIETRGEKYVMVSNNKSKPLKTGWAMLMKKRKLRNGDTKTRIKNIVYMAA